MERLKIVNNKYGPLRLKNSASKQLLIKNLSCLFAGVCLIPAQNSLAAITTYTDYATWAAAVTGPTIVEDFNSIAPYNFADENFFEAGFNGICINGRLESDTLGVVDGTGPADINGSRYLGWSGSGAGPYINYNLSSNATAFGFSYNDTDNTDIYNIKVLGQTYENPPFSNGTGTGFFGIISDVPFAQVSMEQTAAGGTVSPFGVDDIYTNATLGGGGTNFPPSILDGAIINVTIDENSSPRAFNLTLNAGDCNNDTITWSIGVSASNGTADVSGTGTSKAITYIPNPGYSGSDTFNVRVSDGSAYTESVINVTVVPAPDDGDGVDNSVEANVPDADGSGTGDGNNDGQPDNLQASVTSLQTSDNASWLTLANVGGLAQTSVSALPAPNDAPDGVMFPNGMVSFTVSNAVPDLGTVNMDLFVPYNPNINGYYKKNNSGVWVNIATNIQHIGTTSTQISFSLTDGGEFDTDGVVNGSITDPSGPTVRANSIPTMPFYGMVLTMLGLGWVARSRLAKKV